MTCAEVVQWKKAADEEFRSLKDKVAIKIIQRTQLPKGRKPMKCKWVFKKKFRADGSIERWKARCTAKGFTQRQGIVYQETFAPTPRPETGRIMLALAHQFGWHRRRGDVPTGFLNPDLDIDLYMELPQDFEKKNDALYSFEKGCTVSNKLPHYGMMTQDRRLQNKVSIQPYRTCVYTPTLTKISLC